MADRIELKVPDLGDFADVEVIEVLVAPGDEAHGIMHIPAGQSGHPLSTFYRKGHDEWVHGRPSPFLPGEPRYELTLKPAG